MTATFADLQSLWQNILRDSNANQANVTAVAIITALLAIWLERNNRVFRHETRNVQSLWHWILSQQTIINSPINQDAPLPYPIDVNIHQNRMASPSTSPTVRTIKTYTVIPKPNPQAPRQLHLSAWDLALLSDHYIQKGLLFVNPPNLSLEQIIEQLRSSLEEALFHFYPLSGRLRWATCEGGDGQDIPKFLKEFFPHDQLVVNFDGCTIPLLAVQVTELIGGIFVGCSFNHVIGDGTSFWNFFNAWAEIARCKAAGKEVVLSRPPLHDRWFIGGYGEPPIKLPYSSPAEFIVRSSQPLLRERMFHFSTESLAKLKIRANQECDKDTISTFQALGALMWRCITRARCTPQEQTTGCKLAIQNRIRLQPPLMPNYFGNSINAIRTTTTAGELLDNNLGWAAWLVHQLVNDHTDCAIRDLVHKYMDNPCVYNTHMFDIPTVMMISSPRFDMYSCDFGWGKALAVRSGSAGKLDGIIVAYPGWEGGGSVDLEVCLSPEYMHALERDEELLAVLSPPIELGILLGTSNK
ncbi:hypothetical protein LUZ61_012703 [Rhynchospora tenuis]|uniref:Uncharacterized protein n=1 Tax=Rhynchospora tenuis TaxID=198213 RepID=A0AAD6A3U1_9POAL|nr:hypothetical protein LUZ61_012703 [Rhynchospora tenuis]